MKKSSSPFTNPWINPGLHSDLCSSAFSSWRRVSSPIFSLGEEGGVPKNVSNSKVGNLSIVFNGTLPLYDKKSFNLKISQFQNVLPQNHICLQFAKPFLVSKLFHSLDNLKPKYHSFVASWSTILIIRLNWCRYLLIFISTKPCNRSLLQLRQVT